MKRTKRYLLVGALLVILLAATATWTLAQGGDTIRACYNTKDGEDLRIVNGPEDCDEKKETYIEWSRDTNIIVFTAYGEWTRKDEGASSVEVDCPDGTLVTGGGWASLRGKPHAWTSAPTLNGWYVWADMSNCYDPEYGCTWRAYARCAVLYP